MKNIVILHLLIVHHTAALSGQVTAINLSRVMNTTVMFENPMVQLVNVFRTQRIKPKGRESGVWKMTFVTVLIGTSVSRIEQSKMAKTRM